MKKKENKIIMILAGIFLAISAVSIWYWNDYKKTPGELDSFASCLSEKGAKFYGAFWCPHCQVQKALFGKSKDKLPYIECSTTDGKGQLPVCKEAGVESYPTWIFADGEKKNGEQTLEFLSQKTGCILPQK